MIDLGRVASVAGGRVDGERDRGFRVKTISSLENAAGDALAFYADPRQESKLKATAAGAVMLRAEHAALFAGPKVIVADPYLAYARVSALFAPPPKAIAAADGVHPSAIVATSASVHAGAAIGPYTVIGEHSTIAPGVVIGGHVTVGEHCVLGRDTTLDHGVRLYPRTRIGERCHLASGVVIGAGGFGYVEDPDANADADGKGANENENENETAGRWLRIEQLGGVVIGDDVDVGANTTIDRGAMDNTVIGNGVKLDNHIQIAHNVRVGDHTVMAGCVAVAGSAVIGRHCRLGGRAAILGHLEIADHVTVNADSFVAGSITEAGVYSSMLPVQPAAHWRKTVGHLHRLEGLAEKVKVLGKHIKPNKIKTGKPDE